MIGALLALLFLRGFGGGSAGTDDETSAGSAKTSMATTESPSVPSDIPATVPAATVPAATVPAATNSRGGLTSDEEKALSGKVLAVLVDERSYLMEVPTDGGPVYRPTDLDRLLELAKLAEGDSNGIRVRVLHRENARVSAEHNLKTQLANIGIGPNAVYSAAEFIP